jgi:4-hydroxy-3-methylbut-2-enyl diphosphate reductase
MKIEIESSAGFCFGVVNAIQLAQNELDKGTDLYCLGDLVHNEPEIQRLENLGITFVEEKDIATLSGKKLLFRAHGEPPQTYLKVQKAGVKLIDATCPIVLKLQAKIASYYEEAKLNGGQIVIFGDHHHPEALGLKGQTADQAIIIRNLEEIEKIDFTRPVYLFSQTTKSSELYQEIISTVEEKMKKGVYFYYKHSVCGQVANRAPKLRKFVRKFDVIIFVSGRKSSNGKYLYNEVARIHPNTYKITSPAELQEKWFDGVKSVGISGATSTPQWLLQEVMNKIQSF